MDLLSTIHPHLQELTQSGSPAARIEAMDLLVVAAFTGQTRYGGKLPMCIHSQRVGFRLVDYGEDTLTVLGGLGHDLLEDTAVTPELLTELFGADLTRLVQACSLNEAVYTKNHEAGNRDLLARAEAYATDYGARNIVIKVADVLDNLKTFSQVPVEWQDEMHWCAGEWLKLARAYIGRDAAPCTDLAERYRSLSSLR